ncbi:hypothetical protein GCM10020255_040850 [Rhodococcus baikonurensis]
MLFSISYRSDAGGYGRIVNQDLIIRRYLPSDEDVVVDLWSNAAREAHPFLVGEGTGDREQKMREVYLIQADNWVAEHNSEVVGLLGMIGSEIGDCSSRRHHRGWESGGRWSNTPPPCTTR